MAFSLWPQASGSPTVLTYQLKALLSCFRMSPKKETSLYQEIKSFLEMVRCDEYLKPDIDQERRETENFRNRQKREENTGTLADRLPGEVCPWDINLSYAMSEASAEEDEARRQVESQIGIDPIEFPLDSKFFELQGQCLEWWDGQHFDLKRRCVERLLVLYGVALVDKEATRKYKSIIEGTAWQNHHALKEACAYLESFIDNAESKVAAAEGVVLKHELQSTQKELERKKTLLAKKNKELRMLREREKALLKQLGYE